MFFKTLCSLFLVFTFIFTSKIAKANSCEDLFRKRFARDADGKAILSETDIQTMTAIVQVAINEGLHISFESSITSKLIVGRVLSVEPDISGKIDRITFEEDNTTNKRVVLFKDMTPHSLKLFKVEKRELSSQESSLYQQMQAALLYKSYVTFIVRNFDGVTRVEGWLTGVEITAKGEPIFLLNENGCTVNCGQRYKLSEIEKFEANSFSSANRLISNQFDILTSANIYAFLENPSSGGRKIKVQLSETLLNELSIFADSTQASGIRLPLELETLLEPGGEIRLYFSSFSRTIRLTIIRSKDNKWSFGDTHDVTVVSEAYTNTSLHSYNPRYSSNEYLRLTWNMETNNLPALNLRRYLRPIRDILMADLVGDLFPEVLNRISKVLPEFSKRRQIAEIILAEQGLRYDLYRGVIKDEDIRLDDVQLKLSQAIHFLIKNNLVFWSPNVYASSIKPGIYPQGSVNPVMLHFLRFNLEELLFKAMEEYGITYSNSVWQNTPNKTE